MWFSLIIAGALHGLVLLPVILSLAGGRGFTMQEADEEWMSSAIRNGYEYTSVDFISRSTCLHLALTNNALSLQAFPRG